MKRLLVIRNDKIGDFMLAWPAFAMLKKSMPDAEITALVPSYTQELAKMCPYIDQVLVDCGKSAEKEQKKHLQQQLDAIGFDASICYFSNGYNAKLVWRAGIPVRFAPATKLSQFLYNHRVVQRRSRSEKSEAEYNLDLTRAFLAHEKVAVVEPQAPFLSIKKNKLTAQRAKLAHFLALDEQKPWLFVHAGSGGSANNLSTRQYADFIKALDLTTHWQVVVTAGPGEAQLAQELRDCLMAEDIAAVVYDKNEGLEDFTTSIACASAFVAGSTGPLHIAAALDVPTIGFFPAKRSACALRWQPINSENKHLSFSPPDHKDEKVACDMGNIAIEQIAPSAAQFLTQ
ncbi:MAG: glycosyltransferase family 9 protein, partial [Enterovibrio sp.]